MIILIGGSTHTGKTNLAQKLLEKYQYPYLSIDHLKMGLIRSGFVDMSTEDDEKITKTTWPIIAEMVKTAIENHQNMVVEGCYIPYDWKDSFSEQYLTQIEQFYLIMSSNYIEHHFDDIIKYEGVVEAREEGCDKTALIRDNENELHKCQENGCQYFLIDENYDVNDIIDKIEMK